MKVDMSIFKRRIKSGLFYGGYGAGKTFLCATAPRPAWIGVAREGGATTIAFMKPEDFYEPDRPPICFHVSCIGDVHTHIERDIMPMVMRGQIYTIILELSVYSDEVVASLTAALTKPGGGKVNGFEVYGTLETHVTALDKRLKTVPMLNVLYNALAYAPDAEAKTPGGPLIAGKALPKKFPGVVDLVGYMRSEENGDRILHTEQYGGYPSRHRFRDALPLMVRNPTYRKLESLLAGTHMTDPSGNVIVKPEAVLVTAPPIVVAQTIPAVPSRLPPLGSGIKSPS